MDAPTPIPPSGNGGSGNLDQVPPIPLDQILVLVNKFVASTCSFLNEFAAKTEERLTDTDAKIAKVESTLSTLEAIVGLPSPQTSNPATTTTPTKPTQQPFIPTAIIPPSPKLVEPSPAMTTIQPNPTSSSDLDRFRMMLRVGIAREAVIAKMKLEGIDPMLL